MPEVAYGVGTPDIINMSFGGDANQPAVAQAVNMAHLNGDLLIAAAGNGGGVKYPAKYDAVIAVAGTTLGDGHAVHSSSRPEVELSAPFYVTSTTVPFQYCQGCATFYFGPDSGTSFAAPAVAGVAALVWSLHPNWSNEDVRIHLTFHSVVDLGPYGRDEQFGFGRIDALLAVSPPTPPPPPPLSSSIGGPTLIRRNQVCTWVASPYGGVAPYTYEWYRDGVLVGTDEQYSDGMNGASSFALTLLVRDAMSGADEAQITVAESAAAPLQCLM